MFINRELCILELWCITLIVKVPIALSLRIPDRPNRRGRTTIL
jgi:hypothetical protein